MRRGTPLLRQSGDWGCFSADCAVLKCRVEELRNPVQRPARPAVLPVVGEKRVDHQVVVGKCVGVVTVVVPNAIVVAAVLVIVAAVVVGGGGGVLRRAEVAHCWDVVGIGCAHPLAVLF